MKKTMTRAWAFGALLVVCAFVVAGVGFLLWPHGPDYKPVPGTTALDGWTGAAALPAGTRPDPTSLPKHWLVVGWDGASWDLILPLVDEGRMPNLARLLAGGAYGNLLSFKPTFSPVLWTTVATGKSPAEHGILAWGREVGKANQRVRYLFSNADRKQRALWNLLSERGRNVNVIGYHNTFPVEPIEGVMVSNFLYQEHLRAQIGAVIGEGEDLSRIVYPPAFRPEVERVRREVFASLPSEIGRFVNYRPDERERFESPARRRGDGNRDDRAYFLQKAYLFDTFHAKLALELLKAVPSDLTMVHFQGIDLTSHYFLYFHRPDWFRNVDWSEEDRALLKRESRHFTKTVTAFHEYLDAWLGRLLQALPDDSAVLLLSDHGFEPEPVASRTGYHADAPPGILVAYGSGIGPGRIYGATLYDITPTLAAALGLPVAEDLPGRVLNEIFSPEAWDPTSIKTVRTYTPEPDYRPDVGEPIEPQDEGHVLEQLRSLGYIQ